MRKTSFIVIDVLKQQILFSGTFHIRYLKKSVYLRLTYVVSCPTETLTYVKTEFSAATDSLHIKEIVIPPLLTAVMFLKRTIKPNLFLKNNWQAFEVGNQIFEGSFKTYLRSQMLQQRGPFHRKFNRKHQEKSNRRNWFKHNYWKQLH